MLAMEPVGTYSQPASFAQLRASPRSLVTRWGRFSQPMKIRRALLRMHLAGNLSEIGCPRHFSYVATSFTHSNSTSTARLRLRQRRIRFRNGCLQQRAGCLRCKLVLCAGQRILGGNAVASGAAGVRTACPTACVLQRGFRTRNAATI